VIVACAGAISGADLDFVEHGRIGGPAVDQYGVEPILIERNDIHQAAVDPRDPFQLRQVLGKGRVDAAIDALAAAAALCRVAASTPRTTCGWVSTPPI
jgi:hypothetical protein